MEEGEKEYESQSLCGLNAECVCSHFVTFIRIVFVIFPYVMRIEYEPALENFKVGKFMLPALLKVVLSTTKGEPPGVVTLEMIGVFAGRPGAIAMKVAPVFRVISTTLLENVTFFDAFVTETL